MSAQNAKVANSVVDNPVSAALEALKSGADPEQAVYGTTGTMDAQVDSGEEDTSPVISDGESQEESAEQGTGEESADVEPSQESSDDVSSEQAPAKAAKDIEEIIISDDTGRKKITVDWNDREKLKKYVQMAAGMRKFQAERDKTAARLQEIEPKYQELEKSWTAISNAYETDGVKGLVNLLSNRPDGFDLWMQQQKKLETASPAERERIELEDRLLREQREREKLARQIEETRKKVEQDKEYASQESLKAQLVPAFDRYRFAGKLGDAVVEEQLDSAIWSQTLSRLEQYPDTVELTSALIDKEFRTVASTFRKAIGKEAEKKVSKVITQKKAQAQEKVAAQAVNGMRSSNASDDFRSDIQKGDFVSALKSVMTGKVRLK